MSTKQILAWVIATGTAIVISGCQGPLCPEAGQLADAARAAEQGPPLQLDRLKAAIDSYRQCRQTKERSESACAKIDQELADLTRRFVTLRLARTNQRPTRTVGQCGEIISELEGVLGYDDPNEGLRKALTEYRSKRQKLVEEVARLLQDAGAKRQTRRWQEAVSSLDEALVVDPDNQDVKRVRQEILSERDTYYERAIRDLCQEVTQDNCREAASVLDAFKAERPVPNVALTTELQKLLDNATRTVAEQLLRNKCYYWVYTLLKQVNAPECQELLDTSIREGGPHYMALANEEYRNVRDFYAYAAAVKAMELLGSKNDQAFKLHRDCSDRVDDSIQIRIGLATFKSSGDEADMGKQLVNELMSHLHSSLSYGVEFDEREKLEFGIEKVGSTEAVRLLGLKWAVFGDVQFQAVRERDEREVTTWAPVLKTIANPQYETELRMVAELGKDSSALPPPKPTITARVSEKIQYTAGEERLHAQIVCSARIYSAGEGFVTSPQTFVTTREAKDLFYDEVPDANIAGDPLELPSQLKVVGEMRAEIVDKVGDWLLGNFGQRQRRLCEEAEHYIERRELDEAVRAATQGYLYCLRDNVAADDPWFRKLRQMALFDLTEGAPN